MTDIHTYRKDAPVRNGETDPEFDQLDEPSRRSWIRLYDWARTKSIFEPHGKYHRSDPSAAPLIETVSEISTFCLNALKKTSIVRARRRGFSSVLEESLDSNGVSLDELDCLLEVVKDAFPAIQSFHRAREVTCRRDGRAYDWDVASGVTEGSVLWNWGEAVDILSSKLGKYLPDARSLLKQAVEERWIHADPVPAKRPLGACLPVDDTQSLILVNFRGQARSLIEFAHELGHAYHYHSMAGLPEIAQQTPLVMAEFASTLFEGLLAYGQKDDDDERVYHFLLESFLVSASRILGETYVRFAWEKEVFSIRDARIIGTAELHELFNTMQNSIYGEIAQECAWPSSRWVLNSHFFTAGFSNWQYFYGLVSAMTVLDFMEQSRQSSLRGSLADALRNSSCMTPRGVLKQLGVDTVSRASLERGIRYFTRRVDQFVNEESKPTDQ
jgi:oligoendopeptidase F